MRVIGAVIIIARARYSSVMSGTTGTWALPLRGNIDSDVAGGMDAAVRRRLVQRSGAPVERAAESVFRWAGSYTRRGQV